MRLVRMLVVVATATGLATTGTGVAGGGSGADLGITKTDSPDPVQVGDTISYVLRVSNKGPDSASGVTVTDPLPGGTTFVSVEASQGTCSGTTLVTCSLGSLAKDAAATIVLVVKATVAGKPTNTAEVGPRQGDPAPNNNSDSESTTVNSPPVPPPTATPATAISAADRQRLHRVGNGE